MFKCQFYTKLPVTLSKYGSFDGFVSLSVDFVLEYHFSFIALHGICEDFSASVFLLKLGLAEIFIGFGGRGGTRSSIRYFLLILKASSSVLFTNESSKKIGVY